MDDGLDAQTATREQRLQREAVGAAAAADRDETADRAEVGSRVGPRREAAFAEMKRNADQRLRRVVATFDNDPAAQALPQIA